MVSAERDPQKRLEGRVERGVRIMRKVAGKRIGFSQKKLTVKKGKKRAKIAKFTCERALVLLMASSEERNRIGKGEITTRKMVLVVPVTERVSKRESKNKLSLANDPDNAAVRSVPQ